jgi:hypothetical protein
MGKEAANLPIIFLAKSVPGGKKEEAGSPSTILIRGMIRQPLPGHFFSQGESRELKGLVNSNILGLRPDLGHIWLRRLNKTTVVVVLRRGFRD